MEIEIRAGYLLQIIFYHLGGDFKDFLQCSPRTLGTSSNLTTNILF